MLHTGDLSRVFSFLHDQREKHVQVQVAGGERDASQASIFATVFNLANSGAPVNKERDQDAVPFLRGASFEEEKNLLRLKEEKKLNEQQNQKQNEADSQRASDSTTGNATSGMKPPQDQRVTGKGETAPGQPQSQTKVVFFEDLKLQDSPGGGFSFEKECILHKGGSKPSNSGLAGLKSNNVTVKVFREKGCVDLKVPNNSTVNQLIEEYKKHCTATGILSPTRSKEPNYVLLIAEDDGTIDSDFEEVLKGTQFIKNFGNTFFIREEGSSSTDQSVLIRVHLPNSEFQTVKLVPGMQAKDLLVKVCRRGLIDISEHFLHLKSSSSEGPISMHVSLDALIKNDPQILLSGISVRLKETEGFIHAPKEFWSEAEAMAYKQYTVGKIVRFGNTIERMLGIYHDKIVSSSYHKSGTLKTHFSYHLKNLESAELISPFKPSHFKLTLKTKEKGIEGEKVYNFVAKSGDEACEIVGKLKYCSAKLRNKQ